jgi:hypothetical protein
MSLENDVSRLREEEIFKPASKGEMASRQAVLLKNLSTPEVREAVEQVLNYLYTDELKSWQEDHEEGDKIEPNHILYSLNILSEAIGWSG